MKHLAVRAPCSPNFCLLVLARRLGKVRVDWETNQKTFKNYRYLLKGVTLARPRLSSCFPFPPTSIRGACPTFPYVLRQCDAVTQLLVRLMIYCLLLEVVKKFMPLLQGQTDFPAKTNFPDWNTKVYCIAFYCMVTYQFVYAYPHSS